MTHEEVEAFAVLMRRHGVRELKVGELHMLMDPEPAGYQLPGTAAPAVPPAAGEPALGAPVPPDAAVTADGAPIPDALRGRVDPNDPLYSHLR
jgi:hypothetical protein